MPESPRIQLNFQAKVLIPAVTVMALFLGLTLWEGNERMQHQMQSGNNQSLSDIQTLFASAFERRDDNLMQQFGLKTEEGHFGSIASHLIRASGPDTNAWANTMTERFGEILGSTPAEETEFLGFTDLAGQLLAQTNRAPGFTSAQFLAAASPLVQETLKSGKSAVGSVHLGGQLFSAVAVPAFDSQDKSLLGILLAGVDLGDTAARQLVPEGEIAFIAGDRVVASSFESGSRDADLLGEYQKLVAPPARDLSLTLEGEHYGAMAGSLPGMLITGDTGYLLLSSCEQPWQDFHQAQRALLLFGGLGLMLSTIIVWLAVSRATQPLRELRASAEAIGQGDFSKRVPIQSRDELGELAAVFNQTTENLQKSTAQLEKTVEILRATRAQLMHSEKLSAVGEFVAGVAHELNNPLTSVIGFAELVQMGEVDDDTRLSLQRIRNNAERCHKIVQSLLSFARQHPPERKLTSLNALVDSVVEILQYELRTGNIEIVKDLADLPRLLADPHQLQQVFLNIVNNARQAIEASSRKGSIRIATRAVGQKARVRFQDDGPGISEENLAKIFNPFFTTKPVGKGTGLGLSLSYGIIQEHGGSITAESQLGRGTTFIIVLPIVVQAGNGVPAEPVAPPPVRGNGQKILVVDDEEDILKLAVVILERLGYRVQTASDGEAALGHLAQERFDLIVSDLKMPGLGGRELYDRLRQTDAHAARRIIFMTGDNLSENTEEFLRNEAKTCLGKPFSMADFQRAIGDILQKEQANRSPASRVG